MYCIQNMMVAFNFYIHSLSYKIDALLTIGLVFLGRALTLT